MFGSSQRNKLLILALFVLLLISSVSAAELCNNGAKQWWLCTESGGSTCTDSFPKCLNQNNNLCYRTGDSDTNIDPNTSPDFCLVSTCAADFNWAEGLASDNTDDSKEGCSYGFDWADVTVDIISVLDTDDITGLNGNTVILAAMKGTSTTTAASADQLATQVLDNSPLITTILPQNTIYLLASEMREALIQFSAVHNDVQLYFIESGAEEVVCASATDCIFTYDSASDSIIATFRGAMMNLKDMNGVQFSYYTTEGLTLTAYDETASNRALPITCNAQELSITFPSGMNPKSTATCTLSGEAPTIILSDQTQLMAVNNGLDMTITAKGNDMNVIFGPASSEDGLYVTGEGSLEIVGSVPAFILDYNCATYEWDPEAQTFQPITPEANNPSTQTPSTENPPANPSSGNTGNNGGTGAGSGSTNPPLSPHPLAVLDITGRATSQSTATAGTNVEACTPSNIPFTVKYGDKIFAFDDKCYLQTTQSAQDATGEPTYTPTADDYCHDYTLEDSDPTVDETCTCELAGQFGITGTTGVTMSNCAAAIGLPAEYDLSMEEIVALCAANGGQYCPNWQYDSLCLRKVKGRPIPEDTGAWVDEVIGRVTSCQNGEIVACSGEEVIPGGGGGGGGGSGNGDDSIILCSELEPKDEPADSSIEYCSKDLVCKPGATCEEDGTCECTERACKTISSDGDAPSEDCQKFGRNAGTSEEYCDDDVDYDNKISGGGKFVFVLKGDGGGTFFIAESSAMKTDTDGVKRCQPFGDFGSNPPFQTVATFTAADDGKVFSLSASHGFYTLGTYGGAMNEGWICPEGSVGGSNDTVACTSDSDCKDGQTCACVGAECKGGNATVPPTCGNDICDAGETTTNCPADCSVVQGPPECTNGKIEQCFTNPDDAKCFRQRTCTDGKWGSCSVADDLCMKSCTTGLNMSCPRQFGVCAGSTQTCTSSAWPGCNYGQITGYESTEQSCDSLDNDCDGLTDEGCLCGLGSSRACGTDVGACAVGQQACNLGVYNSTCTGGTSPRAEICNDGTDNDCDGSVDEGCACGDVYGINFTRTCGQNSCGSGIQTCQKNGANTLWGECVGAVIPQLEKCGDNIDNDCDGSINEGCGCVEDRECGLTDVGACSYGKQKCTNNIYGTCDNAIQPVAEKCADNIDNDCDGTADENCPCTTGQTKVCTGLGVCNGTTVACVNGTFPSCSFTNITHYEKTELACSDKLDNDCDGKTDMNDTTDCKVSDSSIKCSDGTPNNACSSDKPNYCDGGVLIQDCTKCLCPSGDRCDYTGRCVEDFTPPKTTPPPSGSDCNYDGYCDAGETSSSCTDCSVSTNEPGTQTTEGNSLIFVGIALALVGIALLLLALQQKKKFKPKETQPAKGGPSFASNLKR